ncbi:MAG TPA: hypothetical protein VFW46_16280 [Stellaceae bacterium]|nr:hypothetical protein [Stellaceae bacterium]
MGRRLVALALAFLLAACAAQPGPPVHHEPDNDLHGPAGGGDGGGDGGSM